MADPQDLHDAVWAKMGGAVGENVGDLAGLTTYDAVVPTTPPIDPVRKVVAGYAVLFASPGRLYASGLNGAQTSRDSTFGVTCGGGDAVLAFWAVSKVQTGLLGSVTIGGRVYQIRAREDLDPGSVRKDETKTVPRFFLPLEFVLHVP